MKGQYALFVVGGQDYYGETAKRDKQVVEKIGELLNTSIIKKVITGGMPGIPEDLAKKFKGEVLCVVSITEKERFLERDTGFEYIIAGDTQLKRRLFVTQMDEINCVLVVQGGKYSTHELQLLEERGVPIVSFWGSGGAAGGTQPYESYTFKKKPEDIPEICSTNPSDDPEKIATILVQQIYNKIKNC